MCQNSRKRKMLTLDVFVTNYPSEGIDCRRSRGGGGSAATSAQEAATRGHRPDALRRPPALPGPMLRNQLADRKTGATNHGAV